MSDIDTMTDEQFIKETHRLAGAMSYYNAAEGNWSRETADREACYADFKQARSEMTRRGLVFENTGYLI
jgi:hypothetical protein